MRTESQDNRHAMPTDLPQYNALMIYGRLLRLASRHWYLIILYVIVQLVATPLTLLGPVPLQIAVDSIISDKPLPRLLQAVLPNGVSQSGTGALLAVASLIILIALLNALQHSAASMLKTYTGEKLLMDFRGRLFQHAQRLSLSYHDSKGTADSIYRIQHDATSIESLLLGSIISAFCALFTLASMLYITAQLNGKLALIAMGIAPPLLLVTWAFKGRLRRRWREIKHLESSLQAVVQEVLTAMRVVKAFSREEHEQQRFAKQYRQGFRARLNLGVQERCYSMLVGLMTASMTATILFIGVRDVRSGAMTLGHLLLVMAYLKQLYSPLKGIGKQLGTKQKSLASAERALSLLDEGVEVKERADARSLSRARGEVVFEHVTFSYGEAPAALEDVSFRIEPGTRVGIRGKTGAGKTTLISLLMRFYDPISGRVMLDGVDLRDYRLADLRNQFSIVLQEPVLFSTTIAENISYGWPGATLEQIVDAARAANAHEFIERLPDGYDSRAGERGMRLSGGERQRISLARAFLKNAPILILDEPTSSVDTQTEALIMEAMHRLMDRRTTFMIAHRPSTLQHCDVLLQLERGHLIDAASFEATDDRRALTAT